ncbi:MAG: elongation factor P [Candidatus Omnitrophica bacterium]|nr:elongation factor P [Candidatus Omnitrophota bacterium]
MIGANQLKNGMAIVLEGDLCVVLEFQHVKPGKGGAFIRTKLKSLKNFSVIDRTFRPGDKFEDAYIEERPLAFLYRSGEDYIFMDHTSYEQFSLPPQLVDEAKNYLKEEMEVRGVFHNGSMIMLKLPTCVDLAVSHTEPGVRGDTQKSGTKPATLETGAIVQVPLFINIGDVVKIDTRTGAYLSRA